MNIKMQLKKSLRLLAAASCFSLVLGLQTFAVELIQQPGSVATEATQGTATVAAQDSAVTPAGCCDAGCDSDCGDTCCGGRDGCCDGGSCGGGSCCCEAVCCPKKVTEDVKKHCWKVSSKMVCIPGFRFECNWGKSRSGKGGCDCGDSCCSSSSCCDCGTPTCGRVRCINVLEKHEYKCEECGYEWEAKCVRSSRGSCCPSKCNCPSCGSKKGCCAAKGTESTGVQLTSATTEVAPATKSVEAKPSLTKRLMPWLK